ncbi:hypothetical protein Q3G72_010442 [Acer saccharum]|nr:hypothetical protein Q3G72_010442 [Acer saccharum]
MLKILQDYMDKEESEWRSAWLIGVLRMGVLCSMVSPADRMEMADVAKLCAIREKFLSRRIRDVRPSGGGDRIGDADRQSNGG